MRRFSDFVLRVLVLALGAVLGTAAVAAALCSVATGDFDANGSQDLRILGDAGDQTLRIIDDPSASTTTVFLDCNGDLDFTDAAIGEVNGAVYGEFELFDLRLANGNDDIRIDVPEKSAYNGKNRNVVVQLGAGTNVFRFDHPGGIHPPPTFVNSRMTLDVLGGAGADDVGFRFNGARASLIVLRADLGGGADQVSLTTPDIARYELGSVVDVHLNVGAGNDTVHYSPTADLFDGSVYRVNILGEAGADTVTGFAAGLVDARLFLNVDLGTGNDTLRMNPPHMVGDAGRIYINVVGGEGQDVLALATASLGFTCTLGGLTEIFVHGDDGNDALTVDMSPDDTHCFVDGTVRVHLDGGAGDDTLRVEHVSTAPSTGQYDFLLRGGLGRDDLQLSFQNFGDNLPGNYTVGAALLDGGPAIDECKVVGNALVREQNCEP